jgi:uncharacterized protein (DUF58 family)
VKKLPGFARSLTPNGRLVVVLGLLSFVAGGWLGWVELGIVGIGCLTAVGLCSAWVLRAQPVAVKRTLHPPKVTVGESAIGVVEVHNPSRHRVGPRVAEDVLGDQLVRLDIPALAGGETFSQPYTVPARVRGLFQVGPVRLTRVDPLGFFHRVLGQGSIEELWIRPRTHAISALPSGWAKDLDGPTNDAAPRGSAAFHALREYQHGDDLRHVHWRTSARRNQLMVRYFVDTRRSEDRVVLDPRAELYRDGMFEEAVEVVASVCVAAERAGRTVLLSTPAQSALATADRLSVLDRLALVAPVDNLSLEQAFAPTDRRRTSSTACITVTGDADAREIIDASRLLQRTGLIVVIRCSASTTANFTTHANAMVIDVPSAAALPALWAEAVRRA